MGRWGRGDSWQTRGWIGRSLVVCGKMVILCGIGGGLLAKDGPRIRGREYGRFLRGELKGNRCWQVVCTGQSVSIVRMDDVKIADRSPNTIPGAQCDEVPGAFGRFGYDMSNPIPADGKWYCELLRCPKGHPYWFHRLGSVGWGPDRHMLDHMELLCFGRESHIGLYFDMYHFGSSPQVPEGLSFGSPEGKGTRRGRLLNFPEGLDRDEGP